MSRFYISQIAASGEKVEYSSVSFQDGANFIVGPSNTGKSYIIGCIDFMLGGKEVPFSKDDTGYDTVSMTMKSDDGYMITAVRLIEDGSKGDRGSNVVKVDSSFPDIVSADYRISNKEYSDLLLKLMGIKKRPKVICTQDPKNEDLTFRTLFHFFFINEDNIFEKRTAFDMPSYSRITICLTSLLYLIKGDDLKRYLPDTSVEEQERRATQKAGVISYLNQKIAALSTQKEQLEKALAADEGVDIEARIEDYLAEIDKVEKEIIEASEENRKLLAQIFDLNARLQEARYLSNQYRSLRSQYFSDIKRLNFIIDGDVKGIKIKHKDNCPFCGHELATREEAHAAYAESALSELARIKLQLGDLETTESDTKKEILNIEQELKELNAKNNAITKLLNQKLRPHAAELKKAVEEYKQILQVRQKLQSIEYMSVELSTDAFEKENEEEETAQKFDAKAVFDKDIWKSLSESLNEMIKDCAYTGRPDSYLSLDTVDVVVGGRHKKNQGKGYRAFLNTIMLFNLMKYLEENGMYASHFLALDSPILSLKEKEYETAERTTDGMKESLIRYIIDHCGDNQVIIVENELPKQLDYSGAHVETFTMDEKDGRYGFLRSVRNTTSE